jgi:predicted component of type VI protein secretion system
MPEGNGTSRTVGFGTPASRHSPGFQPHDGSFDYIDASHAKGFFMLYRITHVDLATGRDVESWLVELPVTIGRSHELSVCIDSDSVSRAHCQLMLNTDGALTVRDLGSTNGTYVNHEKIQHPHLLMPGDVIQIGSVTLRVEFKSDTDVGLEATVKSVPRRSSVSPAVTQPMRTLPREEPPPTEPRKWWEFWK